MKKRILIIEDSEVDRTLLSGFLIDKYKIIEATSGTEGLEILSHKYQSISVILLDLIMPNLDGYQVLKEIKKNSNWQHIPVIITSCKAKEADIKKAVDLGAVGYVTKPYDHIILDTLISNVIHICELSIIANETYKDKLTDLYNRDAFFTEASKLINSHPVGYYVLSYLNIEHFKILNNQYGEKIGDKVLKHIAECLSEVNEKTEGISARFTSDRFAILFPAKYCESEIIDRLHTKVTKLDFIDQPITVKVGRYLVSELSIPVSTMYDMAMLAESSIQGKYNLFIATYDESMRNALVHEQKIVSTMVSALESGQFEVWYQPQYNHATGCLIGAEALVRWRNITDGHIIPPNDFIPVFEKNGFIYELDKYVWEQVCIQLRKWIDQKIEVLPISINISRMDIFHKELKDVITGLLKKYDLPINLLRLEITESAFSEAPKVIYATVHELIEYGFTVEIDDFGSGYSSLNTLKDVLAQVLKLDIKFFENTDNSNRGGNIVESIVRMAKWIGMSIIAEGVEEVTQANYLKSIGCYYIQGYLYAKPMPLSEYEKLLVKERKESKSSNLITVKELNTCNFWDPKSIDTLVFNSFIGGACVFEYHDGQIELLRNNDQYIETLGVFAPEKKNIMSFDIRDHLINEEKQKFRNLINDAIDSEKEVCSEIKLTDSEDPMRVEYLQIKARLIAVANEQYLIYCLVENCTEAKKAEIYQQKTASQLQFLNESASDILIQSDTEKAIQKILEKLMTYFSGDRAYVIEFTPDFSFSSNTYEVCAKGISHEIDNLQNIPFSLSQTWLEKFLDKQFITIEDAALIKEDDLREVLQAQQIKSLIVVPLFQDGKLLGYSGIDNPKKDINQLGHLVAMCDYISILITRRDFARNLRNAETELLDNLPCGAALYEYDGKQLSVKHLNKHYWELVNREEPEFADTSVLDSIHPHDKSIMIKEINAAIKAKREMNCDVRILYKENEYKLFHIEGRIVPTENGKYLIYSAYTLVSKNNMSLQELLPVALSVIMKSSTDITYIKDTSLRYIAVSPSGVKILDCVNDRDVFGKSDIELFGESIGTKYIESDKKVLETGNPIIDEYDVIITNDGEWHNIISSKYPILDEEGNAIGIYGISHDITQEKEKASQLELLSKSIPGGIASYELTKDGLKALYFNDGFFRSSGYTREEFIEHSKKDPLALIHIDDKEKILEIINEQSKNKDFSKVFRCECRCKLNNGDYRWYSLRGSIEKISEERIRINAVLIDIDENKRTEEYLRVSEEEYRLAAQMGNNAIGKYSISDSTVTIPADIAKENSLPEVIEDVPYGRVKLGKISTETKDDFIEFYNKIKHGEKSASVVYQKLLPKGWRWISSKSSTIFDKQGNPLSAVISFIDITEHKEIVARAEIDSLTGILNRMTFTENVNKILNSSESNTQHAFLMLDLDKFKQVNDVFGHSEGDKTLIRISNLLRSMTRSYDLVGRLGGDEFVVFLKDIPDESVAARRAKKICELTRRDFGKDVFLSASIGIAMYPRDGNSFDSLYKKADETLYKIKGSGKNNFGFFSEKGIEENIE